MACLIKITPGGALMVHILSASPDFKTGLWPAPGGSALDVQSVP